MKYSFIIPVFNCYKTINNTIDSILASNLTDYEIIIVDDGSTDDTKTVCKKMCLYYPEIKYFYNKNGGVSKARNYGLSKAQGEYVLFVDADDLLRPFNTSEINSAISDCADMILFGMSFIYKWKSKTVKEDVLSSVSTGTFCTQDISTIFSELFKCNYLSPVWNKFIRREILINNDIWFNSRLNNYEDLDFTLRALTVCQNISILGTPYYVYQNEYGKDRTSFRIAKIDDIMENTDIIAKSFFALDEKMEALNGIHIPEIYSIILQIYLEIFRNKMQTSKMNQVVYYCQDFMNDSYVKKCLTLCPKMKDSTDIRRILKNQALRIYIYYHYISIRHKTVNMVKLSKYCITGRMIK